MNVLEKILEEMKERAALHDVGVAYEMRRGSITDMVRHQGALEELDAMRLFIRSHMDDVPDNNDGWIPVEERLPEDERMVLVTCQTKKRIRSTNRAYYDGKFWHGSGSMSGVTAWQPLPKPYKEEADENRG